MERARPCFAPAVALHGQDRGWSGRRFLCGVRTLTHPRARLPQRAHVRASSGPPGRGGADGAAGGGAGGGAGGATHGVRLGRAALEGGTRRGRTLRTRRWTTLAEVGVDDGGAGAGRVEVAMAAQAVGADFRVTGATRARVRRRCDRCARTYTAASRGRFEVWLVGAGALGERAQAVVGEDGAEATEAFAAGVAEVALERHVHDAVWLGVATKSLCGAACAGVRMAGAAGSVVYAPADARVGGGVEARGGEAGSAEADGGEGATVGRAGRRRGRAARAKAAVGSGRGVGTRESGTWSCGRRWCLSGGGAAGAIAAQSRVGVDVSLSLGAVIARVSRAHVVRDSPQRALRAATRTRVAAFGCALFTTAAS